MRLHHRSGAFILLLLAACGESRPPVVLVHTSDPHLLDGKRTPDEKKNQFAFAEMMDTIRGGLLGTPAPRILVVTGDFGIEVADPRFTTDTTLRPIPPDSARALRRMDELANIVASEINGSPFSRVYFVPGNNDVYLESADVGAWSEVDTFVARVQSRLKHREIRDLTACYRRAGSRPADCVARLDSPYALVGFPTVSLKNAPLKPYEYVRYVPGAASVPPQVGIAARIHRQDSLHLEMLRRFREVLSEATAGGWRAIVVTHIPDLEDPFAVDKQLARAAAAAGAPPPAQAAAPVPQAAPGAAPVPQTTPPAAAPAQNPTRLSPQDREDAWNASPAVFEEWKALLEWPRVAGMLAGHFHDTAQDRYRRPYTWSDVPGRARPARRLDRCRIFVAPPLAEKNQDSAEVGARGFARITVRAGAISRDLYWYRKDQSPRRFEEDRVGRDVEPDTACGGGGPAVRAARQGFTLNPLESRGHTGAFLLSAVLAPLAVVIWAAGEPSRSMAVRWLWARRGRVAPVLPRLARTRTRRTMYGGAVGGTNLLAVQLAWEELDLVLFALFWFLALIAILLLLRALLLRWRT
ncbi:MAG TPA: hypothetical protein VF006_14350 [Longimicrobium sp.]